MARATRTKPASPATLEDDLWEILGKQKRVYDAVLPRLQAIVRAHPSARLAAVEAEREAERDDRLRDLSRRVVILRGAANAVELEVTAQSIQEWLESLNPKLVRSRERRTISSLVDTWFPPSPIELNAILARLHADAGRLAEVAHACGVVLRQGARRKPGPKRSQPELIPYFVGDALKKAGIPLSRGSAGKWAEVVSIVYKAAGQTPPEDIKRELIRAYPRLKGK